VLRNAPQEEFFDLAHDRDCVKNLALGAQSSSLLSALREQMHAELREQGDPRMEGKGAIFDEYPHANKANLGFYERFMAGENSRRTG